MSALKRTFLCLVAFSLLCLQVGGVVSSSVAAEEERTAWIPKSKHGEARTLVDPGPKGLLGEYTLRTLDLPSFVATYSGADGMLAVRLHPPGVKGSVKPNWVGKRVAITMVRTTLSREKLRIAMEAVIGIVQKREHRWGWLWRSQKKEVGMKTSLSSVYRDLAYGRNESLKQRLAELDQGDPVEFAWVLDGVELAYLAGANAFARTLAKSLSRVAEDKLVKGEASPRLLQANRLLLARAYALAGDLANLKRIEGGILGREHLCQASGVASSLYAAGRKKASLRLLEEQILARGDGCDEALDLAVTLYLKNDDVKGAKRVLKTHGRSMTNRPGGYLARARVFLAEGRLERGSDALRTALKFNSKLPAVYDLLASAILLQRRDVPSLSHAKIQREEKLKNAGIQFYAGVLCAAYEDGLCVEAALGSLESLSLERGALPIQVLSVLAAAQGKESQETQKRLATLWEASPHLTLPMLVEATAVDMPERPSSSTLIAHMERVYGPGFARMGKSLSEVSEPSSPAVNKGATTVAESSLEPSKPAASKEPQDEEEFPLPPWLLLSMGAILALFGLLAAIKNRQRSNS
jgi:hypothetical protein